MSISKNYNNPIHNECLNFNADCFEYERRYLNQCTNYFFSSYFNRLYLIPNPEIFFNMPTKSNKKNNNLISENEVLLYCLTPTILNFPIKKGDEYTDCNTNYEVIDFFENLNIQNLTYQKVYCIKSNIQLKIINNNDSIIDIGFIYYWINQDYGIIKLKIERDDLSKTIELVNANIIKN